jgi:hypothetical protein
MDTGESLGAVRESGTVELHIREVAQLFDSFDPCPFHSRDLDADAEEYIVASVQELRQPPAALVVHIDQAGGAADDAQLLEGAIHKHFVRKIALATRELRVLLRRGWISGHGAIDRGRARRCAAREPGDRWLGGDVAAARDLPLRLVALRRQAPHV